MIGSSIGHYTITAKLGQGGMGVVYRATDTKLDREVAIKLLPDSFAENTERLARFDREAKILANLSHPNIAGIYGIEQSGDARSLILELVQGEDLSQILKQGPLSITESLEIGRQLAEAIDAAHEKGIIHRDLKPGNIKMNEGGGIKVLDFGLAKALIEPSESASNAQNHLDDSPTITDEYTQPGTILGTAAYMSPEQARGKHVDKLSDIWSFGAILFECLTGKRAFQGEDFTETLARIVQGAPDWSTLPERTPPTLRFLLEKCLTRNRKNRLRDIADARLDLERISESLETELSSTTLQVQSSSSAKSWISAGVMLLVGVLLGIALVTLHSEVKPTQTNHTPKHAQLMIDRDESLLRVYYPGFSLSPNGDHLVYNLQDSFGGSLYLRSFIDGKDIELPNTKGGYNQFFSPDGRFIGFNTITGMKKVPVSGGPSIMIAKDFSSDLGTTWGANDQIVGAGHDAHLSMVPAGGGDPVALTGLKEGEVRHIWPQFLPDGKNVLFVVLTEKQFAETVGDTGALAVVDVATGDHRLIDPTEQYIYPRYSPTGHILYASGNHLFARPFDADTFSFTGNATLVLKNIETSGIGAAYFDVNQEGTLAYLNGFDAASEMTMAWFNGSGIIERATQNEGRWEHLDLSPDETSVALVGDGDIWLIRFKGDQLQQLTQGMAVHDFTRWTSDGTWIYFTNHKQGNTHVWRIKGDFSMSQPELLFETNKYLIVSSVSKDLQTVYLTDVVTNNRNAWRLDMSVDPPALTQAVPEASRMAIPTISPDDHWMAYVSGQTGRRQIYLQHTEGGPFEMISTDGGSLAKWDANGDYLFYYNTLTQITIMSVTLSGTASAMDVSEPKIVCSLPPDVFVSGWDASKDGERVLALTSAERIDAAVQTDVTASTISVIFNWAQHFKKTQSKQTK